MEGIKENAEEGKTAGIVYEVKWGICKKCYIGETGRSLEPYLIHKTSSEWTNFLKKTTTVSSTFN